MVTLMEARFQNVLCESSGYTDSEISDVQFADNQLQCIIPSQNISFFGFREALINEFGDQFKEYTITEDEINGVPVVIVSVYLVG